MLPATPGTYALLLPCDRPGSIIVGRLGRMRLRPGWYVYIGSAFGPGGLRARVGHHLCPAGQARWHIDYLRARLPIGGIWYRDASCEHEWAALAAAMPGAEAPMAGFGSSDCGCPAHLIWFPAWPSPRAMRKALLVTARSATAVRSAATTATAASTTAVRSATPAATAAVGTTAATAAGV